MYMYYKHYVFRNKWIVSLCLFLEMLDLDSFPNKSFLFSLKAGNMKNTERMLNNILKGDGRNHQSAERIKTETKSKLIS